MYSSKAQGAAGFGLLTISSLKSLRIQSVLSVVQGKDTVFTEFEMWTAAGAGCCILPFPLPALFGHVPSLLFWNTQSF